MLWLLIRHIYRHWRHCRSLSFCTLGCGDHWEPDMAMLYIHCNRCDSTGCIPVKRFKGGSHEPVRQAKAHSLGV